MDMRLLKEEMTLEQIAASGTGQAVVEGSVTLLSVAQPERPLTPMTV